MREELREIIKDMLNDRKIFFYYPGALLFKKEEMNELRSKYMANKEEFKSMIKRKIEEIKKEISDKSDKLRTMDDEREKGKIKRFIKNREDCLKLAKSMLETSSSPFLMEQIMDYFEDFGILSCSFSTTFLDDIRRVVEGTNLQMTEQFVLYKMERGDKRIKESLKNLLDYIERLYAMNLSLDERAFIIGKLSSFVEFP